MKIYNLTGTNLSISVGQSKVHIPNLEMSSSIVVTPGLIKTGILPLIKSFGDSLLLVPNTNDMMIFDTPGCMVPSQNIVDDKEATKRLNQAKAEFNKKNKSQQPKPEPKPNPKDEAKKKAETERKEIKEKVDSIVITKEPGTNSQTENNELENK